MYQMPQAHQAQASRTTACTQQQEYDRKPDTDDNWQVLESKCAPVQSALQQWGLHTVYSFRNNRNKTWRTKVLNLNNAVTKTQ